MLLRRFCQLIIIFQLELSRQRGNRCRRDIDLNHIDFDCQLNVGLSNDLDNPREYLKSSLLLWVSVQEINYCTYHWIETIIVIQSVPYVYCANYNNLESYYYILRSNSPLRIPKNKSLSLTSELAQYTLIMEKLCDCTWCGCMNGMCNKRERDFISKCLCISFEVDQGFCRFPWSSNLKPDDEKLTDR